MASINQIQDEIIEEFGFFDHWTDRYEYLIDLGKKLPLINSAHKTEDRLIRGCQSQVWLHAEKKGDHIIFTADCDALITSGIISLLIRVLSDQPAEEIVKSELYFIDQIGLDKHLSPTRANGLLSMVQQMKQYAASL